MAAYKFLRDWAGGTYVAPGVGAATMQVSYNKDEIISDGKLITNNINSEPPNFIEFFDPTKGTIRVPFGGTSAPILKEFSWPSGGLPPNNVVDKKTDQPTASKFTFKNVFITVAVIGVIFGVLKLTKVI